MYPGPDDPDLGIFVANLERELAARGHELERAVVDRRAGGKLRHFGLALDARRAARRFRPDVVYAHFLAPAGLIAALASRAPLVVTAHGQDVENARERPAVRAATRYVVRRSAAVIAVSEWLRERLVQSIPERPERPRSSTAASISSGSRLAIAEAARAEVGWRGDGTAFLCLGALSERKNVLRLAAPSKQRGEGTLTFVGDGPLRPALEGRPGIELAGRVGHDRGSDLDRRLRRPLSAEPRRAVRPRDPGSDGVRTLRRRDAGRGASGVRDAGVGSPRRSRERRASCPQRSRGQPRCRAPTSRRAPPRPTATSSCRRHGWRRFSSEPLEIGEPDLDERTNGLLEPGRARDRERLLVGRADLLRARRLASGGCRP